MEPSRWEIAARNITSFTTCKSCNNTESINHLFLYFDLAQKVWKLAPFAIDVDARIFLDLSTCWSMLCDIVCLAFGYCHRPGGSMDPMVMQSWSNRWKHTRGCNLVDVILLLNPSGWKPVDAILSMNPSGWKPWMRLCGWTQCSQRRPICNLWWVYYEI